MSYSSHSTNHPACGKIMSRASRLTALAGLALFAGVPLAAQAPDAAAEQLGEDMAVSPARLAAAAITVDSLFPLGTYERMMKGTMDQLMDSMLASVSGMTMGDMAGASGLPEDGLTDAQKTRSLGDVAREKDPHFDERMKISTRVMMDEMVGVMSTMEPAIREALTQIYARKFTVPQLAEMNAFFATETGSVFARDYMMVFVDPEMMESMMGMVPEMMQAMPAIMQKVQEATAHLPPPSGAGEHDNNSGDNAAAEF